jgi:cyclic pyranopterin phosphate synthase
LSSSPDNLIDSQGRVLRDLRVSVTDRCNFRCLYCLPETDAAAGFQQGRFRPGLVPPAAPPAPRWQARPPPLTFDEIERAVRLAVQLGIEKVRLTGGEPLLQPQLPALVQKIARLHGLRDLAMTTNGFLFPEKGQALRDAGLRRVSFSLDSLDRDNFKKITGRDGLSTVLAGVELAQKIGLQPVKVNAVIIRGLNDHEIVPLARFARDRQLSLRFIEFMPLDSGRVWNKDLVVSGAEILLRLQEHLSLQPVVSANPSETARRWTVDGGAGEIGIIAPVTEPFCGHCNRLRLTADGKIRTCLFSAVEHDLGALLRNGASDEGLRGFFRSAVWQKEARHHIGEPGFVQPARTMSRIGG